MTETPRDPWLSLTELTPARIALGRVGGSLPTSAHLAFQLAHARARDAVHHPADLAQLAGELGREGVTALCVSSAAVNRGTYLARPDLGRKLRQIDRDRVTALAAPGGVDVAIVIADGLSGAAVDRHAAPLTLSLRNRLREAGWSLAPVVLVEQGRVAIGDEIGALLGARLVLVLLGERPGLTAPDSLGAYLTFSPRPGRTDAERNCVSNIRPDGLRIADAAERIGWLVSEALRRQLSGVPLKEEMGRALPGGSR